MFYVIAYIIVIMRIAFFILIWLDIDNREKCIDPHSSKYAKGIGISDKIATYFELILGI